jgi:hypothetical protein
MLIQISLGIVVTQLQAVKGDRLLITKKAKFLRMKLLNAHDIHHQAPMHQLDAIANTAEILMIVTLRTSHGTVMIGTVGLHIYHLHITHLLLTTQPGIPVTHGGDIVAQALALWNRDIEAVVEVAVEV